MASQPPKARNFTALTLTLLLPHTVRGHHCSNVQFFLLIKTYTSNSQRSAHTAQGSPRHLSDTTISPGDDETTAGGPYPPVLREAVRGAPRRLIRSDSGWKGRGQADWPPACICMCDAPQVMRVGTACASVGGRLFLFDFIFIGVGVGDPSAYLCTIVFSARPFVFRRAK